VPAQTVDEYLAALPEERRGPMDELRRTIRGAAPAAIETIAYAMPAFRSATGRFLVSYDAYKAHYSLFPSTDGMQTELGDELRPFLAGKGTIRFPADAPIPTGLVERIVKIRVAEVDARDANGGGRGR
jgi:uncharacterized protein YdhG (YjbR/CyaY superfamily)